MFGGTRELFVVQLNADPAGEMTMPSEQPKLWRRTSIPSGQEVWWAGSPGAPAEDAVSPPFQHAALRLRVLYLPSSTLHLSLIAIWTMHGLSRDESSVGDGYVLKGCDGVQVRALRYDMVA